MVECFSLERFFHPSLIIASKARSLAIEWSTWYDPDFPQILDQAEKDNHSSLFTQINRGDILYTTEIVHCHIRLLSLLPYIRLLLKNLTKDKHDSLFVQSVNEWRKKFHKFATF